MCTLLTLLSMNCSKHTNINVMYLNRYVQYSFLDHCTNYFFLCKQQSALFTILSSVISAEPPCEVVDNPLISGMIVEIATFHLGTVSFPNYCHYTVTNHRNHPNHKSNDNKLNIDESTTPDNENSYDSKNLMCHKCYVPTIAK